MHIFFNKIRSKNIAFNKLLHSSNYNYIHKKKYVYINSCKQFIYYEKKRYRFKHNERNSRKLNKYQSRISSTFSARLPLIFIHRANRLSLIKQHAIAEDQQISCSTERRKGKRGGGEGRGVSFSRVYGEICLERLKITVWWYVRERKKKKKIEDRALPRFHPWFESRSVNRRGIPVRGWFRLEGEVSPARPWLHVCRGGKESLRTFANPSKPCNPTLINVLRARVGVCPTDPYASHSLASRSCC